MPISPTDLRMSGKDDFGSFRITASGHCSHCFKGVPLRIKYGPKSLKFPNDIQVKKTILKSVDCHIGLNCGCYAKLHRQVAHIQDKLNLRKNLNRARGVSEDRVDEDDRPKGKHWLFPDDEVDHSSGGIGQ